MSHENIDLFRERFDQVARKALGDRDIQKNNP
jgi:hypothetical protein